MSSMKSKALSLLDQMGVHLPPVSAGAKLAARSPISGEVLADVAALDKRLTGLKEPPRAYIGTFGQPGRTHRFFRGDPMQPREEIPPGSLTAFGAPWQLAADAPEADRRPTFITARMSRSSFSKARSPSFWATAAWWQKRAPSSRDRAACRTRSRMRAVPRPACWFTCHRPVSSNSWRSLLPRSRRLIPHRFP